MKFLIALWGVTLFAAQPLVVVSVDGLDNRYLTDADKLGLKTPNIRRLLREGQVAKGVVGAVPTVTWPSHTTIITGVDPVKHGILANWRPPGEKYLDYGQIQVPTLIAAAKAAGLKTAAVNWPVTVNAPLDWNLPEVFAKRRGADMDLKSIEARTKPADLVARIAAENPSFAEEWVSDRTRTLAVVWILKNMKPDLFLLHLVDLDTAQHENAPFSRASIATLEHIDSMLGDIMNAMPKGAAFALVSDHGFERIDRVVNPKAAAPKAIQSSTLVIAPDAATAAALKGQDGVGREIPKAEYERFPSNLPSNPAAVFEPAPNVMFGDKAGEPEEIGNHGFWPTRYRSVFILRGPGIPHETLPEMQLHDLAGRLAKVLGVKF